VRDADTLVEETQYVEDSQPSVRDELNAAWDAATPAEETQAESEARARDEKGRFAPKQVSDQPAEQQQVEAVRPIDAPRSWSAEEIERFRQLPRETQEYLAKRESDRERYFTQRAEEIARQRQRYQAFEQLPQEHLQTAVQIAQGLSQDARGTVAALARHYGISPEQAVNATAQAQGQQSPEVEALRREIHEIKAQSQAQVRAQLEAQAKFDEDAFVNERDESGELVRPYYHDPEVYETACAFALQLRQANPDAPHRAILERAYRDATRSIDRVWELEQARMQAANERRRVAEAKAKAQSARVASASINGSGASGQVSRPAGNSVRDELLRSWAETMS
jgi:hypothetical protein